MTSLMAAIGAQGTNAYTSNDVTCYTEDIPSNEIENWAKIQADRFQNMVIRGFHTELEAVYEEYNIGLSSDNRKLFATISKMLYQPSIRHADHDRHTGASEEPVYRQYQELLQ